MKGRNNNKSRGKGRAGSKSFRRGTKSSKKGQSQRFFRGGRVM